MVKKNDIASFFYYMWNCWDEHECAVAFEKAECGWRHLWNKWREYNSQNGHYGAVEEFFANLDDRNQNLLVERALEMYSGKKRNQMKKIFKVIVGCVIVILTLKACRLNYVCDVVDSIPKEIRERIITEHPECANIDLLVKFWETKGDSLVSEIVQEQIYDCELTEYLKLHPEENN